MVWIRRSARRAGGLLAVALVVVACGGSGRAVTSPTTSDDVAGQATLTASPPIHAIDGAPMSECTIDGAPGRCGFANVYENRDAQSGRQLRLLVGIFPATDPNPRPDPIFFLAGGPGGNAVGSFSYALTAFPDLHRDHDFVLVDQRGTGQFGMVRLPATPEIEGTSAAELSAIRSWVDSSLSTLDADPTFYTSWIAADDLDQVRESLGYDEINLFGGSYGATMAQVYLAAHPEHVRTVTLTGVSLLDVPLFEHAAVGAAEALDRVLARCEVDGDCSKAYPQIRSDFETALAIVKAGPVTTWVTNPQTRDPIVFDEYSFADVIERSTVSLDDTVGLPRAIHHAAVGDWDVLAGAAAGFAQPPESDPSLLLMSLAIRCSENWARWDPVQTARKSEGSFDGPQIVRMATMYQAVCSAWPKAPVPALDGQAVRSNKPVLLLVGGADPADPPENSADAPIELPNSVTALFPAGGHCVERYGCAPKLMTQFIEAGTAIGLDVSCAKDAPVPAFDVSP